MNGQNNPYSDYESDPYGPEQKPPFQNIFIPASIMFGVTGIITSCCIYISLVCGGLSIIFALLSKGGEKKLQPAAKNGLLLGIIAVAFTIVVTVTSLFSAIRQYGGFDNFMEYYQELYSTYMNALS